MARLPTAEDLGRRPIPSGGRPIVAPDTSAGVRALGFATETVAKAAQDYEREQDTSAIFAARRAMDDWEREAIFDPQKGAINRLGQNAFGVTEDLGKSFDQVAGKLAEGLTSDRQRRAFEELSAARRAQVMDWGAKHVAREKEVFDRGQYEADLKSMSDRAALFPERAAGELSLARDRIVGFMRSRGRSTEEIDAAVKDQSSRTHAAVISSMLNAGRGEEAAKYLADNKDGMTADAALRAEAALKETNARTRAQSFADDVMTRGLNANDALKEARQKFTGIEEDAAVNELKTRFAEAETIKARAAKEDSDAAWKALTSGQGRKGIAPELWDRLPGNERKQINDWLDAKWRQAKADAKGDRVDDTEAYYGLRKMAAENPAAFADIDLMKQEPFLNKSSLSRLIELQASINKKDAKAMQLGQITARTLKLIDQDLRAAKIDMTPKEGTDAAKKAAAFKNSLIEALDAASANGTLDEKRAREIGLGLLKEGFEQGTGIFGMFQSKKRAFEMDPTKSYVETRYDDIPADVRKQIEATLPRENTIYGNSRARMQEVERIYQRAKEDGALR